MAEYIVTVKKEANWEELNTELTNDTSGDASVDSNIIPDRAVPVSKLRPTNKRNTHYDLTAEEVNKLKNDSRVEDIIALEDLPDPVLFKIQDGQDASSFNKGTTSAGNQDNYGLLRHISATNNFGSSILDPGSAYNYVLDGTGVDVVIMDSGIEPTHPEWQDAEGNSRLKQVDWYSVSGVSGSQSGSHYTDTNGHGTHVAGTVAGKTFGWAKNAHIYAMKIQGTGYISLTEGFDIVTAWHNSKGTGRPTVVNMSFGYGYYLDSNVSPNTIGGADVAGGEYRGANHTETVRGNLLAKGVYGATTDTSGIYFVPRRISSIDADIQQMVTAGIHVVVSAGNNFMKHDEVAGTDYDNFLTDGSGNYYHYHRGSSPHDDEIIRVGALRATTQSATLDQKASFSSAGPGVDIYACGEQIISACSNTNEQSAVAYNLNGSFKQVKMSGTSMAAPQVAGIVALVAQVHPDWTPAQIKGWMVNNAGDKIFSTGQNNDYSTDNSILGGSQKVAYLTMNGSTPFTYSAS